MTRRITAVLTMLTLVFFSFAPAHAAAANAKKDSSEGLVIPLQASSPDQGSFVGVLKITRFARDGNGIVAVGLVTGTLTDELGVMTGIVRTVSLPVQLPGTASRQTAAEAIIQQTCDILHLVLGPLHLDLLGLIVALNQVHLDITADPTGGLLGSLLCAIAGLLDGSSPVSGLLNQIVDLLNQILGVIA